jgi:hypothetical protein
LRAGLPGVRPSPAPRLTDCGDQFQQRVEVDPVAAGQDEDVELVAVG